MIEKFRYFRILESTTWKVPYGYIFQDVKKGIFSNYQTLKITLNFGILGNFRIFAVAWALLLICLITKIWTSFKLKSPHPQKLESKWPITL